MGSARAVLRKAQECESHQSQEGQSHQSTVHVCSLQESGSFSRSAKDPSSVSAPRKLLAPEFEPSFHPPAFRSDPQSVTGLSRAASTTGCAGCHQLTEASVVMISRSLHSGTSRGVGLGPAGPKVFSPVRGVNWF